ncbi:hypothetical protein LOK49_LG10G00703 [Camellia lanceoleosa]|uniref:Uncharacterized protein n=1 Tax=Camellia lanceoleosa TaxID=1840588 RepID=A0ACC0GCR7_9ERIC|nr:hypothetical protein LOK49_LG10G00703 [Camellia lanceoleosa]
MEEEGEKRKTKHEDVNDAVSGTMKKPRETAAAAAATEEEEVEEFFAILRRIHVAVSYFDKGSNGDPRQMTEGGSRLMETIEMECAGAVNGVEEDKVEDEREKSPEQIPGLDLDLNAVPDPEENPGF